MKPLTWAQCALCLCLAACTGEPPEVPETHLRKQLKALCTEAGVPGISVAYVQADGSFGRIAVGVSDRESGRPLHPNDRMLAASIGKTFVAATALVFSAEGRLDLDAPVSDFLGDTSWFSRLPSGDLLRVRHLLHHTSGLPDHVHLPAFQTALRFQGPHARPFTCPELVAFILDHPPLFQPGEDWAYSDTNYVLLGMVLESVAGRSLYREVEERFFIPLSLHDTRPTKGRFLPGLVPGYAGENPFGIPENTMDKQGHLCWHPANERWGGGWMSTAGDLARWGDALLAGTALPPEARAGLRNTVPTGPEPDAPRYGPGIAFYPRSPLGPIWGHGGWIPGYVSSLRHYSDQDLTVAIQINTDAPTGALGEDWMQEIELRIAGMLIPPPVKPYATH